MTLHIHRAERADTLAAALAELLSDTAGRRVRAGGGLGPGPRHRTLAHPTDVAPPRPPDRPVRRHLRRRPVPVAGRVDHRGGRCAGTRPLGTGRGGVAAAGGDRRVRVGAVVPHPGRPSGLPARRAGRRTSPRPPVRGGPPGRRPLRRLRDPPAGHAHHLGGRQRRGRLGSPGAAGRGLAAGTLAPARASGSRPPTRSTGWPTGSPNCAPIRRQSICPNGSRCSARPRCRPGNSGC